MITRRHPGFTLVEVLAVVAILSLVAGLATVRLAASSDAARRRAAAAGWQDLEARGRLLARTAGPVAMTVGPDQSVVRLHARATGETLSRLELPPGVTGHLEAGAGPVIFDRLGRSDDYAFELRSGDRVRRYDVYGLTGRIREGSP